MSKLRQSLSIFFPAIFLLILCGYKPIGRPAKRHQTLSEKKAVFTGVNCQYTNKMKIDYSGFNTLCPKKSKYYQSDKANLKEYARKYASAVESKKSASMYLKWISDAVGYGIYATNNIKTGDFVGEYTGVLREVKDTQDNLDYAWYYALDSEQGKKLVVDAKDTGNELRFINHSSDPNTMRIDVLGKDGRLHICYIARKDIPRDGQLTVDYGSGYWSSRTIKPESF